MEGKVCTGLKLIFINDFSHFPDYNCTFLVFSITLCLVTVSDVLHWWHTGSRDHLVQGWQGDFRPRPVYHLQGTQGQHHHNQQCHGAQFGKIQRLCAQPVWLWKGGRDCKRIQVWRDASGKYCGDGLRDVHEGGSCMCMQVSQIDAKRWRKWFVSFLLMRKFYLITVCWDWIFAFWKQALGM